MIRKEGTGRAVDLHAVSDNGCLLKRTLGEKICIDLRKELRDLEAGDMLSVDMRKVKYATSSCLSEILRIFEAASGSEYEDKSLVFRVNLKNEELVDCLSFAVKGKGIVVPAFDERKNWRIFGDLSKALRDTLEILGARDTVTSTQVSKQFSIPLSAASNRLNQLFKMKLVYREEKTISSSGGRQYVYKPISARFDEKLPEVKKKARGA